MTKLLASDEIFYQRTFFADKFFTDDISADKFFTDDISTDKVFSILKVILNVCVDIEFQSRDFLFMAPSTAV